MVLLSQFVSGRPLCLCAVSFSFLVMRLQGPLLLFNLVSAVACLGQGRLGEQSSPRQAFEEEKNRKLAVLVAIRTC